jgi:hypothetical protein
LSEPTSWLGFPIDVSLGSRGVSHFVMALPLTLKKYLKAKEELWKLEYFTMLKYNLQKSSKKETKILQDNIIITL